MKGLLSSPITPVLVGLAIVLAVGFWVMNDGAPASGEKTAQTDKGSKPASQAGGGTASPTTPPDTTTPPTSTTPSVTPPAPKTETPASTTPATDQAVLAARSKIDRSAGAAKGMLVTAYYSDGLKSGLSLQPVEIKVAQSVERVKLTAEQVVTPPQELKLYSNVPAGTKVLGVNLKGGVVTVDLSTEVTRVRGAEAVNNIMASFVYSLTAIPEVKAVQLWANGRPAILDGLEWTKPVSKADLDAKQLYKVETAVVKYTGS